MTKARIYTVLAFRKLEDSTRVCYSHMVAAITSKEAEEAIKEADSEVLEDCDLFINTDAICDQRNHQVMFFVSGSDGSPPNKRCTEDEFQGWARVVTRDHWESGDLEPAPFRKMRPSP
jgi:hypothetical protein